MRVRGKGSESDERANHARQAHVLGPHSFSCKFGTFSKLLGPLRLERL